MPGIEPDKISSGELEKLSGEVVRVLFCNQENQYCVLHVLTPERKNVTVCGTAIGVDAGEYIQAVGSWVEHPEYGRQFKADTIAPVLPESAVGLKRFLASGAIPGIGAKTAAAIVDYFGEKTQDILTNHPNRLREIPKLGMKKIAVIREAWKKYGERRNSAIFLQSLGISTAYCARLFKRYGDNAAAAVRQNPYRLAQEVDGIGFARADRRQSGDQAGLPGTALRRSSLCVGTAKSARTLLHTAGTFAGRNISSAASRCHCQFAGNGVGGKQKPHDHRQQYGISAVSAEV